MGSFSTTSGQSLQTLFEVGRLGDLHDAELLDRFCQGREDGAQAFRMLLERYGPMVLAVCRSVLKDSDLADDAFQATFLVLIRRAGSIRRRQSVGPWLHGVALRVARRARSRAIRLRTREHPLAGEVPSAAPNSTLHPEWVDVIHEEIDRLPRRYREPVILCCLEERSYQQAAERLGVAEPTVRGRLHRGRIRLAKRLRSRGLDLETLLPLSRATGWLLPTVSPALLESTLQLCLKWLTLDALVISPGASSVLLLAQGVIRTMIWHHTKIATIPLIVAACALGSVVLGQPGQVPGLAQQREDSKTKGQEKKQELTDAERRARKSEHIRDLLSHRYDLGLQKEVSLERFLKTVKQATSTKDDPGIPIYVNPDGLEYAGMKLNSNVPVEAGEKTLADHLQYALKGAKLWYEVEDGLLKIDSRLGLVETRLGRVEEKLDRIIKLVEGKEKLR
jgi:RNA polymerase sigma factor (sigma-70 family)